MFLFVNCSKRNNSYIERFKLRFSLYILTKNTQLWIQIINLKQTFRKIPLDIFQHFIFILLAKYSGPSSKTREFVYVKVTYTCLEIKPGTVQPLRKQHTLKIQKTSYYQAPVGNTPHSKRTWGIIKPFLTWTICPVYSYKAYTVSKFLNKRSHKQLL